MFVRLKILAISHLGLQGWQRPGTTAPQSNAAPSIFCGQNAPCQPSTSTITLGLTSALQVFYFHSITRSALPLQVPGDAWQCIHPHTEISQGWHKRTLLCAQGWHPLTVCHPWCGRNGGNEITSPECHQEADTSTGRGPDSPGHRPQMTPALAM